MSDLSEIIKEEIKFLENQQEQAKEIFIGAVASVKTLKKVLESKKEDKK